MKSITAISLITILSHLHFTTNASPTVPFMEVGAVYSMNNDPSGNFILSSAIGQNGLLTLTSATSTKGIGSSKLDSTEDPLGSQNSLIVVGDRLYAVNAGSNTISTFSINPNFPTDISLIGQPVNSGGEFPLSLAVSPRSGQICVLNAGQVNGVNCYKPDSRNGLVEIPNTNRQLHRNQTTPPGNGLNDAPSTVLFSKDGSALYATVRGVAGSTTDQAFVAAWSVDSNTGALSDNFVKSFTPPGGGVPFGMTLLEGTNALIVTDPASGFDLLDFGNPTAVATRSSNVPIPGESAVCWVRFSSQTGNYYFADLGTGLATEVHIDQNLQSTIVRQYSQGLNAALDELQIATVLGKDHLYLLASGLMSINVLALNGPGNATPVQNLSLSPLATNGVVIESPFLQGIAVYTN